MSTAQLVANFNTYIVNPLLALIFAVGLAVFVWGVIEFLGALNQLGFGDKEEGKSHMFWGLIGMFVMVAAWALLQFIASNVCGGLNNCFPH
jgi:zinc transporter ZupT